MKKTGPQSVWCSLGKLAGPRGALSEGHRGELSLGPPAASPPGSADPRGGVLGVGDTQVGIFKYFGNI